MAIHWFGLIVIFYTIGMFYLRFVYTVLTLIDGIHISFEVEELIKSFSLFIEWNMGEIQNTGMSS